MHSNTAGLIFGHLVTTINNLIVNLLFYESQNSSHVRTKRSRSVSPHFPAPEAAAALELLRGGLLRGRGALLVPQVEDGGPQPQLRDLAPDELPAAHRVTLSNTK